MEEPRAGDVLADPPRRVRAVHRAAACPSSWPAARLRTGATGRCRAGSGTCLSAASPRGRRARRPSSSTSRTGAGHCRSSRSTGTGPTAATLQGFFGRMTYLGEPVYGTRTASAAVNDTWARNIYIDVFDSDFGPGWRHDTAISTHPGSGGFCFTFVRQAPPAGYPSTKANGNGLGSALPRLGDRAGCDADRAVAGAAATTHDPAQERAAAQAFDRILGRDAHCAAERYDGRLRRALRRLRPLPAAASLARLPARRPAEVLGRPGRLSRRHDHLLRVLLALPAAARPDDPARLRPARPPPPPAVDRQLGARPVPGDRAGAAARVAARQRARPAGSASPPRSGRAWASSSPPRTR